MQSSPVKLHVYDLSGGLAASMSRSLIGKQIDGIWYVPRKKSTINAFQIVGRFADVLSGIQEL